MPGSPWTYRPQNARRSRRQHPLPTGASFHTTTAWAAAAVRQADAASIASVLGVGDGADAVATVAKPGVHLALGQRRMARC